MLDREVMHAHFCICDRDESGICMLHAIRQYDGEKMMWPLTKVRESVIFFWSSHMMCLFVVSQDRCLCRCM